MWNKQFLSNFLKIWICYIDRYTKRKFTQKIQKKCQNLFLSLGSENTMNFKTAIIGVIYFSKDMKTLGKNYHECPQANIP